MAWWDNPTMRVTLDAKRRLTVPVSLATTVPGDQFEARFDADDDAIVFRRVAAAKDWLEVMKECPASVDDLPRRRRALPRRRKL
jgi:bifunctional DNA-binding transcriptional regulator/antitoxin component of YhaV-PrlF toxin-antitoxin module